MDKVSKCFSEKEPEFVERVLDEDCELNFDVENIGIELEQICNSLNSKGKDDSVLEQTDKLTSLQDQMQKVVITQQHQQKEFMEYITNKENKQYSTSVKLPKFELNRLSGNKLEWCAFWDAFECTIHKNFSLSNIEKFNYLHSKLEGEAKQAIAGLALSNENYSVVFPF